MTKEDPRVDRDPETGKPKVDWEKVSNDTPDPRHKETRTHGGKK